MVKNKTFENENNVEAFIAAVADERKRADSLEIIKIMQE